MTIDQLNNLPADEIRAELLRCCGCKRWVEEIADRRPFDSVGGLLAFSDSVWNSLSPEDWKEAFSHHPRIGDAGGLKEKFAATAQWASKEQSGVESAPEEVLESLAEGNRLYERKFGYIFIVCATGKSAGEMLSMLRERLGNSPDAEVIIAAGEQAKITNLRLQELVASHEPR
jgi:2-oxo-4-hydroxy-4-carboxy-5-ureidoimidazoline decarboxylase